MSKKPRVSNNWQSREITQTNLSLGLIVVIQDVKDVTKNDLLRAKRLIKFEDADFQGSRTWSSKQKNIAETICKKYKHLMPEFISKYV